MSNNLIKIDPIKRLETLLDNSNKFIDHYFSFDEVNEFVKEAKYCAIISQSYEEAAVIRDIERQICHRIDEQAESDKEEIKNFITLVGSAISAVLCKIKN